MKFHLPRLNPTLFLVISIVISFGILALALWWRYYPMRSQAIPVSLFQEKKKVNTPLFSAGSSPPQTDTTTIPSLQLTSLFTEDHSWTATLSAEKKVTLIATGDVLMARTVNAHNVQTNTFTWPFEKTADFLRSADITYINLETPLVKDCPLKESGMVFCGDLRSVEGLSFAGIDVVNLANNHAGNYGLNGVEETKNILTQHGLRHAGTLGSGPTYYRVKNLTFAFLGYNEVDLQPGVNLSYTDLIKEHIAEARKQADIVIVQFHWGNEYTYTPTSHQKGLAHFAIDEGADLIIGNHPHWIQPPEIYKEKLIMYSHGNFIFDQMWSRETREGIVGRYTFYNGKVVDAEIFPVWIEPYGQPRFMTTEEKTRIMEILKKETK